MTGILLALSVCVVGSEVYHGRCSNVLERGIYFITAVSHTLRFADFF